MRVDTHRGAAQAVRLVTTVVMVAAFVCALPESARGADETVRVDHQSFWYQRLPRWNAREPWEERAAPPDSSRRVARLLREVLASYPKDFPQPPPIEIVVQAPSRAELSTLKGYVANRTSYGGARLVGSIVFIDIHQPVFAGPDRLNDAELRAFLGHELVHAYQYGKSRRKLGPRELFRREIEAYTWELFHLEPAVRAPYRGDIFVNLYLYRELLGD